MSWFWWLIWFLMSGFIVGTFVWTTQALFQQKASWKAFATKRKLKYTDHGFLQSGSVFGLIDGYEFKLASEERPAADVRGRKFVTMFQFKLPARMPAPGAVGSGEYRDFVRNMNVTEHMKLEYSDWNENLVSVVTDDLAKMTPYYTPERLKIIDALIKQKGVTFLFLFDERDAYIRIETGDPFLKLEQLEKLVDKMLPMLKVLAP